MLKTNIFGHYPKTRLRRNRQAPWVRDLVQEHHLHAEDFILPIFVTDIPSKMDQPVNAYTDTCTHSIDGALRRIEAGITLGLKSVILFQSIDASQKTKDGSAAYDPNNFICKAIAAIKKEFPHIGIGSDVALDLYTTDGHDGLMNEEGEILNDESLIALSKQALVQAQAGSDFIAPSDMMDGRIGAIRDTLDQNGYENTLIFSYTDKYESAYYISYRQALGSQSQLKGNKLSYQLNPANIQDAIREAAQDIQEGTDAIIVKPGQPYLDVLSTIKQKFQMPTFGFHILGECSMLKCAEQHLDLNYEKALYESLIGFKRAGADAIITYAALDALQMIKNRS